jgi:hypothetical protein
MFSTDIKKELKNNDLVLPLLSGLPGPEKNKMVNFAG